MSDHGKRTPAPVPMPCRPSFGFPRPCRIGPVRHAARRCTLPTKTAAKRLSNQIKIKEPFFWISSGANVTKGITRLNNCLVYFVVLVRWISLVLFAG
ncbi:hypothetical protein K491DRAFT_687874 [Lophiostoma macrostomum CBS 122681]|uniref:Uncharacterized protein n=1 Tax=Lophiostoma macrostomum CBS 122681 TaxID=1314788 RepID=A0A6A6TLP1_9PLEO|nr:hypothetical protein K491DRAFT_687874 [Lophiostoma macrostomum CBS 122681]